MTAKQYLKQVYRLNALIDADLVELKELKQLLLSVPSPKLSSMPSGGNHYDAPFVNPVQKIVDLEAQINAEIDRYAVIKTEIRYYLEQMKNSNERAILQKRYLLFDTWEKIAKDMNYSLPWIYNVHRNALKNFDKIMKNL